MMVLKIMTSNTCLCRHLNLDWYLYVLCVVCVSVFVVVFQLFEAVYGRIRHPSFSNDEEVSLSKLLMVLRLETRIKGECKDILKTNKTMMV